MADLPLPFTLQRQRQPMMGVAARKLGGIESDLYGFPLDALQCKTGRKRRSPEEGEAARQAVSINLRLILRVV